jgi:hypothetical protein
MPPDEIWRRHSRLKIRNRVIYMLGVPQVECGLAPDQLAVYEYSENFEEK